MVLIESRLGVETTDINQNLILVKAEASELLPSLIEALSGSYSVDILSNDSEVSNRASYLAIYQLRGHNWILLQRFGVSSNAISDKDLARQLSDRLHSLAIAFEQSDSAFFSRYSIWENGYGKEIFNFSAEGIFNEEDLELISSFNQQPNISKLLIVSSDVIEDYGGKLPYEYNCVVYSSSRTISEDEVGEPYEFVSDRFKSLGAYVPGVNWHIEDARNIASSFSTFGSDIHPSDIQELTFVRLN